jgi:hypothetical protein
VRNTFNIPTYTWQDNWPGLNSTTGQGHHGMAVDADGHLHLNEWLTGTRMIKLVLA